jgi:K+-transporting ATPase ATPase C chain
LQQDRAVLARWARGDENLGERWAGVKANADFLAQWEKDHPAEMARWRHANPKAENPSPADLAVLFFDSYARGETTTWPQTDGRDIQAAFFEVWWRAHPRAEFKPVPADMVMASGSGLDPHITLANALYQLDRVADRWAEQTKVSRERVAQEIRSLLEEKKEAPLGGLAGVDLVNVMEVNLALPGRVQRLAPSRE